MTYGAEAGPEAEVLEPHDRKEPTGNRLTVSVLTPTAALLGHEADEVIGPGVEGEFGILPGHVPFISALKPGVLTVREGGNRQLFAVGPGYLQVGGTGRVQVLVQQAVAAGDVDIDAARADKTTAEEQLRQAAAGGAGEPGTPSAPGAVGQARANLAWAQARLDAHAAATHPGRS